MTDDKPTTDPVDKGKKEEAAAEVKQVLTSRDIKRYKIPSKGRPEDPFKGYPHPMGDVKDTNGVTHKTAHVVICIKQVAQDPSGKDYTITKDYKYSDVIPFGPYAGETLDFIRKKDKDLAMKLIKEGKVELAPLENFYSELIRSWATGRNIDVVFDREIELADGPVPNCAIVKDSQVRAQLFFTLKEKTGKVVDNPNFAALDINQMPILETIFTRIHAPSKAAKVLYKEISGED